jgi:hypothetical protein
LLTSISTSPKIKTRWLVFAETKDFEANMIRAKKHVAAARIVAFLLLGAAILKSIDLVWGTSPRTQYAALLQLILIQVESVLGVWLLSGVQWVAAFRMVICFFAIAGATNLYSLWKGEVSCGCFGRLEVSPAITLAVNGLVVFGYCILVPRSDRWSQIHWKRSWKQVGWLAPLCFVVLLIGVGYRFSRVLFRPSVLEVTSKIDFGIIRSDQSDPQSIALTNKTDRNLNLWGAIATCDCVQFEGLPVVIEPKSTRTVQVTMKRPKKSQVRVSTHFYGDEGIFDEQLVLMARASD